MYTLYIFSLRKDTFLILLSIINYHIFTTFYEKSVELLHDTLWDLSHQGSSSISVHSELAVSEQVAFESSKWHSLGENNYTITYQIWPVFNYLLIPGFPLIFEYILHFRYSNSCLDDSKWGKLFSVMTP